MSRTPPNYVTREAIAWYQKTPKWLLAEIVRELIGELTGDYAECMKTESWLRAAKFHAERLRDR